MKILQNIKLNYYGKIIEDYLNNSQFNLLKQELEKILKIDEKIYVLIIKKFFEKIFNLRTSEKIFSDNIIYINSFLEEDKNLVTNFLKYYFKEQKMHNLLFSNYHEKFLEIEALVYNNKFTEFDDIVQKSIIYQSIMTFHNPEYYYFINNDYSFFSSQENFNFTDSKLTMCYFHVVDHPYAIFEKIKKYNSMDSDLAKSEMFNLDSRPILFDKEKHKIEIHKKGWSTYTASWNDPNVVNSLKGLTIKKEDFYDEPVETYAEILLHLKQNNFNISINYELISEYVKSIPREEKIVKNLSNNEKKFIQNNINKNSINIDFDY